MTMFVSKLIHTFLVWARYDENVRQLSRLSDRELADIGISRSDIRALAREGAQA
jgi:uncharacterized protein YjiS (DUF1127 family)